MNFIFKCESKIIGGNDHVINIFTKMRIAAFLERRKINIKRPLEWTRTFSRPVIPQPEIKLKSCSTKPEFALADFNNFLLKLQMTLVYIKMAKPFLKKKIFIMQDIFAVVSMLICLW